MSQPALQARFLELIKEHRKILFKIANAYSGDHASREDLIQEITLQLWRSFGRYDERLRFSTWMYRVALNVAISYHRGESRRHLTATDPQFILQAAAQPADSSSLEEELALLRQLIGQLNELDRALVILHLDGNRYDAIATILGISESNVGTRLSRIKQKLRQQTAAHKAKDQNHGTR